MSNWISTATTEALRVETDHRRGELERSWPHRRQAQTATPRPTSPARRRARRWWSPAPAGA